MQGKLRDRLGKALASWLISSLTFALVALHVVLSAVAMPRGQSCAAGTSAMKDSVMCPLTLITGFKVAETLLTLSRMTVKDTPRCFSAAEVTAVQGWPCSTATANKDLEV